jgi:serine/threonine-protein kinase
MAETYRSRLKGAAGVTKPVLIKKVLPEHASNPDFTTMFIREARISASLSHGNIAQVYDFGRVNEEYFLAMEYVDGQPLNRLLKRTLNSGFSSIPLPIAAFICGEICRGLHYAHTRVDEHGQPLEIVHRDISPDNVIISYEGQVKIVDFGIAKVREPHGLATEPGVLKGKFLFFSPEQARGQPVDARADVWATGVVLYNLLCGKLPVEGPPYVVLPRLASGEFPHPRELNPALPMELDALVMKALAVKREERYSSCLEFGDALAEFLSSLTPRCSAISLSYFVQELFREDLRTAGRVVQVPDTFHQQFIQWRRGEAPSPSEAPAVPETAAELQTDVTHLKAPLPSSPSRWGLLLGVGVASALLGAGLTFAFATTRGPVPPLSRLEPLALPIIDKAAPPKHKEAVSPPAEVPVAVAAPSPPPESAPEAQDEPRPASPNSVEAETMYERATKAFRERALRRAAEQSDKCTQLDPDFAGCFLLAGDAYTELGQETKAIDRYKAFLRLASSDKRVADLRQTLKRLESRVAYEAADAHFRAKLFKEALSHSAQCLERVPDSAECHLLAGMSAAKLGQRAATAEHYRKFLELAPEHTVAHRIRNILPDYEER